MSKLGPTPWRRLAISADVIQHRDQRYNDVGDWEVKTRLNPQGYDLINVHVSDTGNPMMNCRLLLHEITEALWAYCNRVSTQAVDDWDFPSVDSGRSPGNGDQAGAPYKIGHGIATAAERIFAELDGGPSWAEYEDLLDEMIMRRNGAEHGPKE